jgi:hypothetical protein
MLYRASEKTRRAPAEGRRVAGTQLANCSGELYPLVAVINNNIIKAACSLPGPASDTPELFHVYAMDEEGRCPRIADELRGQKLLAKALLLT